MRVCVLFRGACACAFRVGIIISLFCNVALCKAVGVSGLLWPYVEVCVVCGDADSFAMAFRVGQAG